MSIAPCSWIERIRVEEGLPDSYAGSVIHYVGSLADWIRDLRSELSRPVTVGINGGQGSGKSTLSLFLVEWLKRECGLSATCLSLDDLYYGKARRLELSRSSHPLFATRGVPGTHDVALGMRTLDKLLDSQSSGTLAMPRFDKATDDQCQLPGWPVLEVPVDVVVFEGWCVGAKSQEDSALEIPLNSLESEEDSDGRWRAAVNERLKIDYADLFERLDMLIMLRIPSFEKAIEWRFLQEAKLRERLGTSTTDTVSGEGYTDTQLARFMMHFERLTGHMLDTGPTYSDVVIDINDRHEMVKITHK